MYSGGARLNCMGGGIWRAKDFFRGGHLEGKRFFRGGGGGGQERNCERL